MRVSEDLEYGIVCSNLGRVLYRGGNRLVAGNSPALDRKVAGKALPISMKRSSILWVESKG